MSPDAFTMHAEPSLAANACDPRNLMAACMPFWNDTRTGRLQIFTASIKPA